MDRYLFLHPGEGEGLPEGGAPAAEPEVITDPYKLYEGIEPEEQFNKAMDARRSWPKEIKASHDVLLQTVLRSRLARVKPGDPNLKYGDADIQAKIDAAKAEWEKSRPVPVGEDPDTKAMLEKFTDPNQRQAVESILEFTSKREQALRAELDGIRKPLDERAASEANQATMARYKETADAILEKVPHVDPLTVIDVLKKNDAQKPEDRMTNEEIIMAIQELEDDRFGYQLPARLKAKDAKTTELLMGTVMDGIKANEPWAAELMTTILEKYEEAKHGAPAERIGSPKPAGDGKPLKWNPHEAARG